MEVFYPAYYDDFHCLADTCPDSCCKEWAVDVDAESAAYYRALPGSLGDRLRGVLSDSDGSTVMLLENGRCPMWRQDGLCRIQAELGHDALCKTCRDFPRLRHDYGDFIELGLELSCPEAARLILSSPKQNMIVLTQPDSMPPEYAPQIMEILRSSRAAVLSFLDDARHCLPKSLAAVLLYAHNVQAALDLETPVPLRPEDCMGDVEQYHGTSDMGAVFAFFQELEILTDGWRSRLAQTPMPIAWSAHLRALMRYMVLRYWLQAVCDYDLVCRVKLAIVSCLLVGALGGNTMETAQLFSKEIENDPENIEAIFNGAYTSPALTDANLLSILLS